MITSTLTLIILCGALAASRQPTTWELDVGSWELTRATLFQEPRRMHATGTFDVTITPQKADNPDAEASGLSRLSINKRFHGGLDGTSQGEMLAHGDGKTSGGYVAIETFTGTLDGRRGRFALLHRSLLRDGTPVGWTIAVVPGSGTGELAGIDGSMTIRIEGKRHEYAFEYTITR